MQGKGKQRHKIWITLLPLLLLGTAGVGLWILGMRNVSNAGDPYADLAEGVTVVSVTVHNGTGEFRTDHECLYDESGNLVKKIWFNKDGTLRFWYENKYDASGNLIHQYWYDRDGNNTEDYLYEYDTKGSLVKESYFLKGSLYYEMEYGYDALGNRIWGICYVRGEFAYRYLYEYGDSYEWMRRTAYDEDGSIHNEGVLECEYDASGNLLKEIAYSARGSMQYWYEYVYDDSGNEIRWTSYDEDGSIENQCDYEYSTRKPE